MNALLPFGLFLKDPKFHDLAVTVLVFKFGDPNDGARWRIHASSHYRFRIREDAVAAHDSLIYHATKQGYGQTVFRLGWV